jgi:hypothetical protein
MGIALFYVTVSGFFFGWDLRWGFVVLLWFWGVFWKKGEFGVVFGGA